METREIRVPVETSIFTGCEGRVGKIKMTFKLGHLSNEEIAERLVYSAAKLGRDSWFSAKGYKKFKSVQDIPDEVVVEVKACGTRERAEREPPTPKSVLGLINKLNESDRKLLEEQMKQAGFIR